VHIYILSSIAMKTAVICPEVCKIIAGDWGNNESACYGGVAPRTHWSLENKARKREFHLLSETPIERSDPLVLSICSITQPDYKKNIIFYKS
jgi:hypothetical protein